MGVPEYSVGPPVLRQDQHPLYGKAQLTHNNIARSSTPQERGFVSDAQAAEAGQRWG